MRATLLLLFLLAHAGVGVAAGMPPQVQSAPALDSARLLRDLSVLSHDSMAGRRTGTPGAARARAFIVSELEGAGAEGAADAGLLRPFETSRRAGVNVVALVPGSVDADGELLVLTAHYDHLGVRDGRIFNGADDNASGVAALLEITRILLREPLRHTALIAFVDAEEGGTVGSRALVADPPVPIERVALNVNLDMVSRTDGVLWAGGAHHTPELRPILEAVAQGAPLELRLGHDRPEAPEGDDWTDSSDHAAFHDAGIPFVYFGVEDHVDYHRPTDDFDHVDPGEFVAAVRTILMGLRALDAALPLRGPGAG